jgi:hypothetical protein
MVRKHSLVFYLLNITTKRITYGLALLAESGVLIVVFHSVAVALPTGYEP